jgi:hypothetical protein
MSHPSRCCSNEPCGQMTGPHWLKSFPLLHSLPAAALTHGRWPGSSDWILHTNNSRSHVTETTARANQRPRRLKTGMSGGFLGVMKTPKGNPTKEKNLILSTIWKRYITFTAPRGLVRISRFTLTQAQVSPLPRVAVPRH